MQSTKHSKDISSDIDRSFVAVCFFELKLLLKLTAGLAGVQAFRNVVLDFRCVQLGMTWLRSAFHSICRLVGQFITVEHV